jgi:hypothetical protein
MSEMPIEDLPALAELAHEAAEGGRVVYLTEGGKRLVAIIPAAKASELEAEGVCDLEAAHESMAEPGENLPLEDTLRDLGL